MGTKKAVKATLILSVFLILLAVGGPQNGFLQPPPVYAETAEAYVDQGRQAIAEENMELANDYFESALGEDPSHDEANLYYSVTRMLALTYQEDFNRLLDGFGVQASGRDLFNWTAELPHDMEGNLDLPDASPRGSDITAFIEDVVLNEIDAALANLDRLEDTSSQATTPITVLSGEMIGTDRDMEVDYGDVALYRSFLNTAKAFLLTLTGYNLDIDIDDVLAKITDDTLDIKTDLIDAYPDLLRLRRQNLSEAKNSLVKGIDAYLAASAFIRSEPDPQDDDLIQFSDVADEGEFRWILGQIRRSLLGEVSDPFKPELSQFVHLGWLFDNPVALRGFLRTDSLAELIKTQIHPQINWALTHLEGLDKSYSERLGPSDYPIENPVEIDFGDIAMLRSFLYAARSGAKTSYSYDIGLRLYDLIDELANDDFSINEDVLEAYKGFLQLTPDHQLGSAKTDLNKAISEYMAASEFIRAETDDPSDDLFTLDEADADFRALLSDVQRSLAGTPTCLAPETPVRINLDEFYGDPIDLRQNLPAFNEENEVVPGTFPDPTFNGIFPDFSQEAWTGMLENGKRPRPAIAANGQDKDAIRINRSKKLKIAISLDAHYKIKNADWWLLAVYKDSWFHYRVKDGSWAPGIGYSFQGPLFNLEEFPVFDGSLPPGEYTLYFGVDTEMNGQLDMEMDKLSYDTVKIEIE